MAVTDDVARYRVIQRLGAGGMATVTLAEDMMLRRRVALKRVHAGGDARAISRLRREALVGASLSHPNLVSIYDVETRADGDLVIVMEYVAGETLRDAIQRSGGLPRALALEVLDGVAAALDAIHARGIVHRDVKPANILLGREGAIKLADLGIAVAADRTQITNAGEILGTFSYMAPEQLEGAAATPAVDIYALAVVAFEILSGQKARPESNPVALAHAIATRPPPDLCAVSTHADPAVAAVLQRGMAADPARRPRSAGELIDRLRAALGPQGRTAPVAAPPPPAPDTAPVPAVRRVAAPPPAPAPAPAREPALSAPPASPPRSALPRRDGAGIAGGLRRRPVLLLAALTAFALAVLALALADSGGGPAPAKRTASSAGRRAPARAKTGAATTSGAAATASTGAASGSAGAAVGGAGAAAAPGSSAAAVESFYGFAAHHRYAQAWALADPAFRAQLAGYSSFAAQQSHVRSITFHQAQTVAQSPSTATVAVRTTSVTDTATEQCQGSVQLARAASAGWLLHQISINCVP